jgi:uncharacterized protein with PQ loop repeat
MIWQDITIANILTGYALIPQIYKGFKSKKSHIALQTGIITSIALYIIGITFLTLKLYLSGGIVLSNATMWMILLIQSIIYKKSQKQKLVKI